MVAGSISLKQSDSEKRVQFSQQVNTELSCSLSKRGRLLELGRDPITRQVESKTASVQTQGSLHEREELLAVQASNGQIPMELTSAGVDKNSSSAAQVLRLVVGLLGMEVHEQPNNWAQVWLTFQDQTFNNLGLSPSISTEQHRAAAEKSTQHAESAENWQLRVLSHLRDHVARRRAASEESGPNGNGEPVDIWGPDFDEHMDLAEFALRRISHAVSVLQNPNGQDRPISLRQYTEEMVLQIATDLRQWLDQLATLFSLYHVHLLDLSSERSQLELKLRTKEAIFAKSEQDRKDAIVRHDRMEDWWQESKLKKSLQEKLGITVQADDRKIYSQRELDLLQEEWNKEQVEPLLGDIVDLKLKRDELARRIAEKDKRIRDLSKNQKEAVAPKEVENVAPVEASIPKPAQGLLIAALNGLAERVLNDRLMKSIVKMIGCVTKIGSWLQDGLQDAVADINSVPIPSPPSPVVTPVQQIEKKEIKPQVGAALEESHPAMKSLTMLQGEFDNLEQGFRKCPVASGADKLTNFTSWAKEMVKSTHVVLGRPGFNTEGLRFLPPPKWDLGVLAKKGKSIRTVGVNTEAINLNADNSAADLEIEKMRKRLEDEWQQRMRLLKAELEEQVRIAQEATDRAQHQATDALRRLEEESARADNTLADLRRKMQTMQTMLSSKGLGKQAGEALQETGLADFLTEYSDRNVFERLYQDALTRMRKMAEIQNAIFQKTSEQFLRAISQFANPDANLPGLDTRSLNADANVYPSAERSGSASKPRRFVVKSKEWDAVRPGTRDKDLLSPFVISQLLESNEPIPRKNSGSVERPEGGFKARLPSRQLPQSQHEDFSGFSVGSITKGLRYATPPTAGAHPPQWVAAASRPLVRPHASPPKAPGGLAKGESLPKIDCRGQGRASDPDLLESPTDSITSHSRRQQSQRSLSSLSTAIGGGSTPSTLVDNSPIAPKEIEPLLTIASVGISASQSLVVPPGGANTKAADRPRGTSLAKRGELIKLQPGAAQLHASHSAPQLNAPGGIPRLLVQSVQAAF